MVYFYNYMPNLYIIAGCNGAGKTTASFTIFPDILNCKQFVNADNIAYGLSPFDVESVAIEAARIMLQRINELLLSGEDFAIETTLTSRSYVSFISKAKEYGYTVSLIYIWLNSPELAIQRVAERVKNGGHNIPANVIERRYFRGIRNLFELFIPICDYWTIADNTYGELLQVASKREIENIVEYPELWSTINAQFYGSKK